MATKRGRKIMVIAVLVLLLLVVAYAALKFNLCYHITYNLDYCSSHLLP